MFGILQLVVTVTLEKILFRNATSHGLWALGFGRPTPRALLAAAIISAIMLAFFPIFSLGTGEQISLKPDWWWTLLAGVTLKRIGEESLFRGFVWAVCAGKRGFPFSTLIAIASAFPMAYLFEREMNTIWAPVLLHVATHAIRLVDISEPHYLTAVGLWLAIQSGMMFLVYAFLGNLLRPQK